MSNTTSVENIHTSPLLYKHDHFYRRYMWVNQNIWLDAAYFLQQWAQLIMCQKSAHVHQSSFEQLFGSMHDALQGIWKMSLW